MNFHCRHRTTSAVRLPGNLNHSRNCSVILIVALFLFLLAPLCPVFAGEKIKARGYTVLNTRHKHPPGYDSRKNLPDSREKSNRYVSAKVKPSRQADYGFSKSLRKKLSSKSAIIIDAVTGETIYSHSAEKAGQPASTIKVLTGMIALKYLDGSELVHVSRNAARMPSSKVYLQAGKSYYADDLINAVLLSSANDASVALAEKIAGSEKAFAKLMTHKAGKLGAKRTVCKNATGLTSEGQKSTVRDLAVIFMQAMENDEFSGKMARVKVKTRYGKVLRNHNKALWQVEGAEAGKTGYTRAARQTYVGKFSRNGNEIVVAVLGSETMWDDVKNLVEYGFEVQQNSSDVLASGSGLSEVFPESNKLLDGRQVFLVLTDSKKSSLF